MPDLTPAILNLIQDLMRLRIKPVCRKGRYGMTKKKTEKRAVRSVTMACLSPQKTPSGDCVFCFCVFRALVPSCQRKQSFVAGILTSRNGLSRTELFFCLPPPRYFRSFLRPARSHAVEKENFFLPHVSICYRMGFHVVLR